jgi:xylulokinase
MGHVLAIDLGTTGVKVVVVDDAGRALASAGETHDLRLLPGNGAEQDPEAWWQAIGRCSRHVVERAGDITAVAVTSQYMSLLAVDQHGMPLSPCVMWMDQRGAEFHPLLGDWDHMLTWLDRHGLPPIPNDDVAHLKLLLHRQPELSRGATFVEPADALTARLTGRVTATQTTAIGLLSVDNRTWGNTAYAGDLVDLLGIDPASLPTLVEAGSVVGNVTAAAADHLGITEAAVVLTASIDTITSAIGTGAVSPDRCGLIIGTTAVMVSHVPDKRGDLEHGMPTLPSSMPDTWFVMAENGVAGKALELATALTGFGSIDEALVAADTSPTGANGVTFAPWLVGSMAPGNNDDVRGSWLGLGLGTQRADLARAVLEGVALNAAWLFGPFQRLTGHNYDHLVFGGGGAASRLWAQILADCLGVSIHRLADPQNTNARGAAMLTRLHLGQISLADIGAQLDVLDVVEPDAAAGSIYDAARARFVALHGHLATWHSPR